jgi:hypothetical protein
VSARAIRFIRPREIVADPLSREGGSMRARLPALTHEVPTAGARSKPAWKSFESNLAAVLSTLEKEFLVLDVKDSSLYVQVAAVRGGLRCETVSNAFLPPDARLDDVRVEELLALGWRPPTAAPGARLRRGATTSPNFHRHLEAPASPAAAARLIVRTLAEVHRVPGPDRLTYTSSDGEGHEVLLPALGIERRGQPDGPRASRRRGSSAARLERSVRRRVLEQLRSHAGDDALELAAGKVAWVGVGDIPVAVRVLEDPLTVRVYCVVGEELEPSPGLLEQVNEVNGRLSLARLVLVGDSLYLSMDVPASPLRIEQVRLALGLVPRIAAQVRGWFGEFAAASSVQERDPSSTGAGS